MAFCRRSLLVLATALALAPAGALAKEESKIQVLLLAPGVVCDGNGNGGGLAKGQGPIADVKSFLQEPGGKAELQLRVRGLAPSTDHELLALASESDLEPQLLASFTTAANGQFVGSFDLHKADAADAPVDPRGKYLVVEEAGSDTDLLAGWLYGAAEDDCPMTKVKELTSLAPDADADPTGSADARYDMRPNGHGSLVVTLRGVPAGDYDIFVEDAGVDPVETLTPNPGGSARASFSTKPSNGNGNGNVQGHNKKGALGFDPRRKRIEIKQGDQVFFAGPMLAQIEGLNACSASSTPLTLTLPAGSGTAALELEDNCETALVVDASGLDEDTYDLVVGGVDVANVVVGPDGLVALRFDPTPDAAGELPLDFAVGSASSIELVLQP